jgi:hypothetical protein
MDDPMGNQPAPESDDDLTDHISTDEEPLSPLSSRFRRIERDISALQAENDGLWVTTRRADEAAQAARLRAEAAEARHQRLTEQIQELTKQKNELTRALHHVWCRMGPPSFQDFDPGLPK